MNFAKNGGKYHNSYFLTSIFAEQRNLNSVDTYRISRCIT